jgi:hypothetical protein
MTHTLGSLARQLGLRVQFEVKMVPEALVQQGQPQLLADIVIAAPTVEKREHLKNELVGDVAVTAETMRSQVEGAAMRDAKAYKTRFSAKMSKYRAAVEGENGERCKGQPGHQEFHPLICETGGRLGRSGDKAGGVFNKVERRMRQGWRSVLVQLRRYKRMGERDPESKEAFLAAQRWYVAALTTLSVRLQRAQCGAVLWCARRDKFKLYAAANVLGAVDMDQVGAGEGVGVGAGGGGAGFGWGGVGAA